METYSPVLGRSFASGVLIAAIAMLSGCASDPPPPPAQPTTPPAVPVPPTEEPATSEASSANADETPPAPTPECETADECVKSRGEPSAGTQWMCEAGACVAQAAPEPPKEEEAAPATKPKAKKRGKK